MGCVTLTSSRKLACTSRIAGVVAIGIAPYDSLNRVVTTATGVIALPTGMTTGTIARLELKNAATKYLENGVTGGDNRSTGVTGSIACTFNVAEGMDIKDTLMIEQLLKGEVVLFIEKKDGTIIVAGSQLGALAITADGDTGGTIGDLNGFTVTFQTMEPDYSRKYLLTGAGLTAYATALMPYV
jgi:hypothetical protein